MEKSKYLVTLLLLLGSALAIHHELLLDPTGLLVGTHHNGQNDVTAFFGNTREFLARTWRNEGAPSFWNPAILGGTPFLGNPQSGIWYPPNWLWLFADGYALIGWCFVLHQVWAGFGVFCLLRRWNLSWEASLAAGICYLGSPYTISQIGEGHYNQVVLAAWIPWAFFALDLIVQRDRRGPPALALVLAMMVFCGHPQEVYYSLLHLAGWVIGCCVIRCLHSQPSPTAALSESDQQVDQSSIEQKPADFVRRIVGLFILSGILAIGISFIELFPDWLYLKQSVRAGSLKLADAYRGSVGFDQWKQLVSPFSLGGPDDFTGSGEYFWETIFYFGVIPLILALFGLFTGWRILPLLLLSILFAFGPRTPLYSLAHQFIPGVAMFRNPGRMLFLASFFVCLLAGFGLNQLAKKNRMIVLLLGLAALAELTWFSSKILQVIPEENVGREHPLQKSVDPSQLPTRILARQSLLTDWEAASQGWHKIQGYEPVPLVSWANFVLAATPGKEPSDYLLGFSPVRLKSWNKRLLDLAGVRYALLERRLDPIPTGWKLVRQGELLPFIRPKNTENKPLNYWLYENEAVFPPAFVIGDVFTFISTEEQIELLREKDPKLGVILPADPLPAGDRSEFKPAEIVERSSQRFVIEVALDKPGFLILTQSFSRGWTAESKSGERLQILPAYGSFPGVPLPAGEHQIMFYFTPPGLYLGGLVSAVSIIFCLGILKPLPVQGLPPSSVPE